MFNWFKKKEPIVISGSNNNDESLRKQQNLIYAKNVWEKNIKVGDSVTIRNDLKDDYQ